MLNIDISQKSYQLMAELKLKEFEAIFQKATQDNQIILDPDQVNKADKVDDEKSSNYSNSDSREEDETLPLDMEYISDLMSRYSTVKLQIRELSLN